MNDNQASMIYDLLQSKNWDELTPNEIAHLDSLGINRDIYNNYKITQEILPLTKQYYAEQPSNQLRTILVKSAKEKVKQRSLLNRTYPLKYYIAATFILFIFSFIIINKLNKPENVIRTQTVTIDKIILDTIYVAVNTMEKINSVKNINKNLVIIANDLNSKGIKSVIESVDSSNLQLTYNQFVGLKNLIFIPFNNNGINFIFDSNISNNQYIPESEYNFRKTAY